MSRARCKNKYHIIIADREEKISSKTLPHVTAGTFCTLHAPDTQDAKSSSSGLVLMEKIPLRTEVMEYCSTTKDPGKVSWTYAYCVLSMRPSHHPSMTQVIDLTRRCQPAHRSPAPRTSPASRKPQVIIPSTTITYIRIYSEDQCDENTQHLCQRSEYIVHLSKSLTVNKDTLHSIQYTKKQVDNKR